MAYRGEDLDLRTPQSWSPPPSEQAALEPFSSGGRSRARAAQPILVDDIVLACCNHAFDVAVAHRASEVRLEHLLHAMTRVDGASNALETRGIRVSGLRRESATIIAGEIPIGVGAGQTRPRRSDDLETVLRHASAIAYRRNGPANVDDVLDALLDMPPELPGIALLARHGGRIARDRGRTRSVREPQPLPPLTRAASNYDDLRATDAPLSTPRERAPELSRPMRADALGSPVDSIQNSRLDQIENAVRALTSEVLSERKTLSNVVLDLQRAANAERDDANRFRGGLHDRIQSLEQTLLAARKDQDPGLLIDRLGAIERSLDERLADLSRPWAVLSERLQSLEQAVLDTSPPETHDFSGLYDRIGGLERAMRDIQSAKGIDLGPITNRLDIIEEAVLSPDNASANDALATLSGRIKALEDSLDTHRGNSTQIAQSLTGEVRALASAVATQAANAERTHSMVSDKVQALTSGLEQTQALVGDTKYTLQAVTSSIERGPSDVADRIQALIAAEAERNHAMIATLDQQRGEVDAAVQQRLGALEAKLAESVERNGEAQAAHNAELKEVHEALIKLNTNQHTLAGSIDQWRLDGVGDISVISKQLDTIEKSATKPAQMIEQLATSVDNINRVTIERLHRRNRFWYWLFGTDDWLTASWPSQVLSVERDEAAVRGTLTSSGKATQR